MALEPPSQGNMIAWYRADSITTSGSNITGWNDKATLTTIRNLTNQGGQSSSSVSVVPNGLGTRSVVRFAPTSNPAVFINGSLTGSQPFSVFAVVKPTSGYTQYMTIFYTWGSSALAWNLIPDPGNDAGLEMWADPESVTVASALPDDQWHNLIAIYNGGSSSLRDGGSVIGSGSVGSSGTLNEMYVGRWVWTGDAEGAFVGDIADLIFYNKVLDAGELSELQSYYNEYYLGIGPEPTGSVGFNQAITFF